jgi:hypothetical protein
MISQAWLALVGFHWITGEITGCGQEPPMKNLTGPRPALLDGFRPAFRDRRPATSTPAMARLLRE